MESAMGKEAIAYSKANTQDGARQPARSRGNDVYVANLGVKKLGKQTFIQMDSEEYKKWYILKTNGESKINSNMLTKICKIEEKPDNPDESMNSMESVDSNPPQIITSQYPDLSRREEELSKKYSYQPTNR
jgi:hypothetical protein